ncbi:hypothetical protein [Tenacibaculum halocynthiae]|uniref:hypothetical protein n=1 Tax=Tenacibaculum halocynthiae TaxID=1254437 RepID=UPI00389546F4
MKKETNLPIYGLAGMACPTKVSTSTEEFDTNLSRTEKQCGCSLNSQTIKYAIKKAPMTKRRRIASSQIIDSVTGEHFPAQTVHVQNTTNGEAGTLNPNGAFSILAEPEDELKITHIGYKTILIKAINLKARTTLHENSEELEGVEITSSPKKKTNNALIGLGLLAVFGIAYATADDKKKPVKKTS